MNNRAEQQRGLIGRVGEVTALTRALGAACTGRPSVLLIEGPAGIGKTALADHVLRAYQDRATGQSLAILRCEGVAWESGVAFGVARQLAQACGAEFDPPVPGSRQPVLDAAEQLLGLWTAAQREQPLVVVVDDAHWADVESLRAMHSAVRRTTTERLLVILIVRDDPFELHDPYEDPPAELLGALAFLDGWRDGALRPGPLGSEEIRELAVLAGVTLDLPTARRLGRHTRGNPRYVSQLLRELPPKTWQDWQPVLPAPGHYASAVRHRLARCGEAARALVEACSVLGDDVSLTEAAALAGLGDPLPVVDEAHSAGLLTAVVDPGRAVLSFTHPLARAAVLTGIGLTRRRELHHLAAHTAEDPGRRLTHRVAAAITPDTDLADELDRYASARASAGEWAAAAEVLIRASRLSPARARREDRLLRAVDALIGAGDIPQATVFAAELESFPAGTLRDAVLGYLAIMRGRPAEAETFLSRAWTRQDPQPRPDLTAKICQRRVLHALGRWDAPDLVAWARRAVELADPSDPSAVESEAVLGLGLAAMGRPDEAEAAYQAAAAKLPAGAQSQRFQVGRGWVDLALDAPETARRRLESAVPTGYRLGSTRISLWAQGWLARTQFALGAWQEAVETVDRAAARLAEVRIEMVRPLVHWTGAQVHALRGDWDTAGRHLEEGAADLHHYEVMMVPACLARAQVAEARGDYERAVEALSPVVQLPSREWIDEPGFWPWQDVYANALVMTGRTDEADAFLAPCEDLAARRGHHSALARLGLVRGRIAAARGDMDAVRKEFEQALAHLDRLPLPYDRARVNFAYGQSLRRAGKRREADTVLKNARDGYAALGARTYVERCDRELKAGGLNAPRSAPGVSRLTPQEQAVARLVAEGASNQATALELFISVKTVQYHLTHIYAKLGIRSRAELAARFRESAPGESAPE
ncbi:LuxR family transcriptional regulator [Streptomyces sp. NBC_01373]|uniref:helix-turn-helix transcriptional regulator n=1 Tax=Streptomyces sp. NBC_01373 TaxID=2903843 RepID=UPI00225BC5A1|nr:LuxR family transcriptional regulator [Streptomyces sp. NBC_01373]MCX4703811.1 AAA family ATPase [Streptomyces sp. NBC_01373]